jgi:NADH dehydrogenase FAD-containing subunit
MPERIPCVVIVGGGFAGLAAAGALKKAALRIILIDRTNHHLFQPLLYQVATGVLAPGQISSPIREILRRQKNATVIMGEVTGVDKNQRCVFVNSPDRENIAVNYDYLILATGVRRIDPTSARIVLLDAAPRLLGSFSESLSQAARKRLEHLGVEVRPGHAVDQIDDKGVIVAGERIVSKTVIWTAGVAPRSTRPADKRLCAMGLDFCHRSTRLPIDCGSHRARVGEVSAGDCICGCSLVSTNRYGRGFEQMNSQHERIQ